MEDSQQFFIPHRALGWSSVGASRPRKNCLICGMSCSRILHSPSFPFLLFIPNSWESRDLPLGTCWVSSKTTFPSFWGVELNFLILGAQQSIDWINGWIHELNSLVWVLSGLWDVMVPLWIRGALTISHWLSWNSKPVSWTWVLVLLKIKKGKSQRHPRRRDFLQQRKSLFYLAHMAQSSL